MTENVPARALEEPELLDTAEEGVFHAPEEVDGEWFCRWDESPWPCKWVVDTEEERVKNAGPPLVEDPRLSEQTEEAQPELPLEELPNG